mgnify:FL=1
MLNEPDDDLQPKTKEAIVYEKLKQFLLEGRIPTREFLSQRTLASMVDAAVITVRGALRLLENDGLIENVPHWGVRVPPETRATLKDRYYVRRLFEMEAVRQIVRNRATLDPEPLLQLARRCDHIDTDPEGDHLEFGRVHAQLHREIVAMAGSPLMSQMFERISLQGLFYWNAYRTWQATDSRYLGDHEAFIDHIFSRDEEDVVEEMRQHLERGLANELREFDRQRGAAVEDR